MNVHEIFGIWNVRLDFGTDPNQDQGSIFPLFRHWEGDSGIKYELKELRMNVYDILEG